MTKSGTESTTQGDFTAVFRRTLLLKSSFGLFTVSIFLVLACILPLTQRLKSEQERHLFSVVKSRSATVEIFLEKAIETAKQVTSRTKIREMLEKYNRGEISLAELADYTRPKLDDAISLSGNGVGVSRFDARNNLTVSAGFPIPPQHWIFPAGREDFLIKGPERIDGKLYLLVSVPILSRDGQRAGTDIVLFSAEKIREITQDTSGFGKTGEMILGRFTQNRAQSFYPPRETNHPKEETELFRQKELDQAFAVVAKAGDNALPCVLREGRALKVGDRIRYTNWIILCGIDKDELYAPINTLIVYLVLFVTLLLILGLYGMKRLLLPLADQAIIHTEKLQQEILEKQEALKQREQAMAALRESEERYSLLVNNIPEVFWMVSADYQHVLYISPAYEQIWGRSCESLLADPREWLEAVVEEDRPGIAAVIAGIAKNTGSRLISPITGSGGRTAPCAGSRPRLCRSETERAGCGALPASVRTSPDTSWQKKKNSNSNRSCAKPRRWRPSAPWPAALPMILTISFPSSSAITNWPWRKKIRKSAGATSGSWKRGRKGPGSSSSRSSLSAARRNSSNSPCRYR